MTLRKIGLDPGFGAIKVAEVDGTEIVTHVLPSAVGIGSVSNDALSLAGVTYPRRRSRRPFRVAFERVEYLVGPGVARYARPIQRMDFDRFADSPELRAALYAALHRIVGGGKHDLALAIALPVEILQEKTEAQRVERAMRNWLVGDHAFAVDGIETLLTVTNLRAKIAQPVATWFEWGLDTAGQWMRGAEALRAPALIVDEGFNTLDVLVVQGGRVNNRHTGGDTLGMRRAAEQLAETLRRRHGLDLDIRAADSLVRCVANGQKAKTYIEGQTVDASREARQALHSVEADVVSFIERAVGSGRAYKVLLTGGGALALAPRLLRQFPHATVMHNPVLANARGLAKLAVRPGFLA